MPEGALVDAGGGAVVDLLPDGSGEEVLSARKVIELRRNALVVYIKARGVTLLIQALD